MTTARQIIDSAMRHRLNRLSPGETLDADTYAVALEALNAVADEWNGSKSFLFRELLTAATVTGTTGTLGTTWASLVPGDEILSATVQYSAGNDVPIAPLTIEQYSQIPLKLTQNYPQFYAHDGAATVYFYPAATGQTITLRTRQVVSDFADLDTDYSMPKGYRSGMADVLAERLAPSLIGAVTPAIATAARAARNRIVSQAVEPGIPNSRPVRGNVLNGW